MSGPPLGPAHRSGPAAHAAGGVRARGTGPSATVLSAWPFLAILGMFLMRSLQAEEAPVELGLVPWQRDFDEATRQSRESGRPLLLLFQEVPG